MEEVDLGESLPEKAGLPISGITYLLQTGGPTEVQWKEYTKHVYGTLSRVDINGK